MVKDTSFLVSLKDASGWIQIGEFLISYGRSNLKYTLQIEDVLH